MSGQAWPGDDTARLAALWNAGVSSGRIAKALGRSRSSVLCRAHRMGLTPRPVAKPALPRLVDTPPRVAPKLAIGPPTPRAAWRPSSGTIHECQWPKGEPKRPGFRFCLAPALPDKPYCDEHCHIAFVGFGRPRGETPNYAWAR